MYAFYLNKTYENFDACTLICHIYKHLDNIFNFV